MTLVGISNAACAAVKALGVILDFCISSEAYVDIMQAKLNDILCGRREAKCVDGKFILQFVIISIRGAFCNSGL